MAAVNGAPAMIRVSASTEMWRRQRGRLAGSAALRFCTVHVMAVPGVIGHLWGALRQACVHREVWSLKPGVHADSAEWRSRKGRARPPANGVHGKPSIAREQESVHRAVWTPVKGMPAGCVV